MPQDHGIIEEVFCRNFMCHSKLRIKLGPLINFIIGHNGSGKSAVMTALTLCLGAKATVTNRGGSLKAFIKEGEECVHSYRSHILLLMIAKELHLERQNQEPGRLGVPTR